MDFGASMENIQEELLICRPHDAFGFAIRHFEDEKLLPEEEAQHTTMVRGEEVDGRTLVAEARVVACPIFSVAVGGMKNSTKRPPLELDHSTLERESHCDRSLNPWKDCNSESNSNCCDIGLSGDVGSVYFYSEELRCYINQSLSRSVGQLHICLPIIFVSKEK
jgi:hypothetical protein